MNKVTCPKCCGTGLAEIDESLLETLTRIKMRKSKSAVAEELRWNTDGVTINAVSNRLKKLLQLGLVTRKRKGKYWIYKAN